MSCKDYLNTWRRQMADERLSVGESVIFNGERCVVAMVIPAGYNPVTEIRRAYGDSKYVRTKSEMVRDCESYLLVHGNERRLRWPPPNSRVKRVSKNGKEG